MIDPVTGQPTFKIGDFGIARPALLPGQCGTIGAGDYAYMAPEMFSGQYNHQVDMYSLGKVMAEIVTRYGSSVPPPNSLWWSLVKQLTQYDPSNRLLAWKVRDEARNAMTVIGLE